MDMICALSGLRIDYSDPVMATVLIQNPYRASRHGSSETPSGVVVYFESPEWAPVGVPYRGRYDECGVPTTDDPLNDQILADALRGGYLPVERRGALDAASIFDDIRRGSALCLAGGSDWWSKSLRRYSASGDAKEGADLLFNAWSPPEDHEDRTEACRLGLVLMHQSVYEAVVRAHPKRKKYLKQSKEFAELLQRAATSADCHLEMLLLLTGTDGNIFNQRQSPLEFAPGLRWWSVWLLCKVIAGEIKPDDPKVALMLKRMVDQHLMLDAMWFLGRVWTLQGVPLESPYKTERVLRQTLLAATNRLYQEQVDEDDANRDK